MEEEKQTTEVTIKEELQLSNPAHIAKFSGVLKKFITENKLSCIIQNKQYVYCDGWKFAGISFGLTAIPKRPVNESVDKETKYSCECDIVNIQTGNKVGYGFALCSKLEAKKKSFDEYAIASMAQTRAIAKGYRNLLGFIMNAAGFEATPAEEAEGIKQEQDATATGASGLTQEIKDELGRMTTVPELFKYCEQLVDLHQDPEFREYVSECKANIEANIKNKTVNTKK